MPVHNPGRRLMHAVPLAFVKKKVMGLGHRSTNASLSLTSMIDFLVVTNRQKVNLGGVPQ